MPSLPVRFMRKLLNGREQEAGNHVQLEDETGTPIGTQANPLRVSLVAILAGLTVNVSDRAARLLGVISGTVTANQGGAPWTTQGPTVVPTCDNVTLADADTEYFQALPAGCKCVEFQCRTLADVRHAFAAGKVATPTAPYSTLRAGGYYVSPAGLNIASGTLYLASSTAGVVVEIIAWA